MDKNYPFYIEIRWHKSRLLDYHFFGHTHYSHRSFYISMPIFYLEINLDWFWILKLSLPSEEKKAVSASNDDWDEIPF